MQVDAPTDNQLAKYPEQLWPVARRWGIPMLEFAMTVSGCNMALDQIGSVADRFVKLQVPSTVLLNNFGNLCQWILEARSWTFEELQECIQDIGRASELALPRRKIIH